MLFRRLFLCALLVGVCSGLVHSIVQRWQVVPLIAVAEGYEAAAEPQPVDQPAHEHADAPGHDHHDHAAWSPRNGAERTAWTVLANVLAATGYALLLLPLIALWDQRRGGQAASSRTGTLWGAAGWLALYAWPALGLPPELPGTAAAALHARQAWWLLAALCAAAALAVMCLGAARWGAWRFASVALLALPFAIGAPQHPGSPFPGQGDDAAAQLQTLGERFVIATSLTTALYWLVLGTLAGMVVARWIRPLMPAPAAAGASQPPAWRSLP